MPESRPNDEVLAALDALLAVLAECTKRNQLATKQAQAIRRLHKGGLSYRDIFARDEHSLIRQVTRENVEHLLRASARLRWAEARALHGEGMTMDKIALLFGVTRQRISGLLREEGHDEESQGAQSSLDPGASGGTLNGTAVPGYRSSGRRRRL